MITLLWVSSLNPYHFRFGATIILVGGGKKSNKLPVFVEFNDQFQLKLSTASEITQPCEPSYLLHGSPPRLVSLICSTAVSNHGELLCLDSFTWFDIANKAFKSAEDLKMTQEL